MHPLHRALLADARGAHHRAQPALGRLRRLRVRGAIAKLKGLAPEGGAFDDAAARLLAEDSSR
jgi:hypothetical protein